MGGGTHGTHSGHKSTTDGLASPRSACSVSLPSSQMHRDVPTTSAAPASNKPFKEPRKPGTMKDPRISTQTFSATGWPTFRGGYKREGFIGKGACAKVYRMTCIEGEKNRLECAVKIVDIEKTDKDVVAGEVKSMKRCRHKNVLQLHATFIVGDELWIIMPFMNRGSLLNVLL